MATPKQPPGWYAHPDHSGRFQFWNGYEYLCPYQQFEDMAAEVVAKHLEKMFELGFEAGASAAASVLAHTEGMHA